MKHKTLEQKVTDVKGKTQGREHSLEVNRDEWINTDLLITKKLARDTSVGCQLQGKLAVRYKKHYFKTSLWNKKIALKSHHQWCFDITKKWNSLYLLITSSAVNWKNGKRRDSSKKMAFSLAGKPCRLEQQWPDYPRGNHSSFQG